MRVRHRHRVRAGVNIVNLSTPLRLLIALAGTRRLRRGPRGLVYAYGYRLLIPPAPAFTVGNVILVRLDDAERAPGPALLSHEERHTTQYAWSLGPVMIPLYVVAAATSWALSGCPACYTLTNAWPISPTAATSATACASSRTRARTRVKAFAEVQFVPLAAGEASVSW
jgi:hypothetical protein